MLYDQAILARPDAAIRAVIANTGSANACTGAQGWRTPAPPPPRSRI